MGDRTTGADQVVRSSVTPGSASAPGSCRRTHAPTDGQFSPGGFPASSQFFFSAREASPAVITAMPNSNRSSPLAPEVRAGSQGDRDGIPVGRKGREEAAEIGDEALDVILGPGPGALDGLLEGDRRDVERDQIDRPRGRLVREVAGLEDREHPFSTEQGALPQRDLTDRGPGDAGIRPHAPGASRAWRP